MLKKTTYFAAPFLLISLTLLALMMLLVTDNTPLSAYPGGGAPPGFGSDDSYPAPQIGPPAPPIILPDDFQVNHEVFMPIISEPAPTLFSIAGEEDIERVKTVIPAGLATDPYVWGTFDADPPISNIQMINNCISYRNRDINVSPIQYQPGFANRHINDFCWDAGDETHRADNPSNQPQPTYRIAQVVASPDCPGGVATCLDVRIDPNDYSAESTVRTLIQANPSWTFLIDNEPDNAFQGALSGRFGTSSATYARFFAYMYHLVEDELPAGQVPQLVFCQTTYAGREVTDLGLDYCEDAFNDLNTLLVDEYGYPAGSAPSLIYALSTHQYIVQYVINEQNDTTLMAEYLQVSVDFWQDQLQEFEDWAAANGMGDKPLWLTEFGVYNAWCKKPLPLGIGHQGIPCDPALNPDIDPTGNPDTTPCEDDGEDELEDHRDVFYGRHNGEGIWGVQMGQISYLAQPEHQWEAAWWFSGEGNGKKLCNPNPPSAIRACNQTGWVWGDSAFCLTDKEELSQSGITLRSSLNCIINGHSCSLAPSGPGFGSDG